MNYFTNKVIIITGSSMGIGKQTALKLGLQGAKIVLNGRNIEKLMQTADEFTRKSIDCLPIQADISDYNDCEMMINKCLDYYKRLDILVNNAAIATRGYFKDIQSPVWEKVLQINTLGAVFPTKAALPAIEKTKGQIIFISSIGGKLGLPAHSTYSLSKMPLTALVQSLRIEYRYSGIHFGIIYLGFTENDPDKRIMKPDGNFEILKPRPSKFTQSREKVADKIMQFIKSRKAKQVLSTIGKLQSFLLLVAPGMIDKILYNSMNKNKDMYE